MQAPFRGATWRALFLTCQVSSEHSPCLPDGLLREILLAFGSGSLPLMTLLLVVWLSLSVAKVAWLNIYIYICRYVHPSTHIVFALWYA